MIWNKTRYFRKEQNLSKSGFAVTNLEKKISKSYKKVVRDIGVYQELENAFCLCMDTHTAKICWWSDIPGWLWIVWITELHHNDSFSLRTDIPAGKELLSLPCSNFNWHIFVFSSQWSFCLNIHLQWRRKEALFCRCSKSFIALLEADIHFSKWKRNIKAFLQFVGMLL